MRVAPLFVLILSIPCLAQEPAAKAPLPDDAAQNAALTVVADVYKPDYEKAKTPTQKVELAKKLLGEAVATKEDPVSRFVLFRVARDIASQQGDLTTAFNAISRINAEYEADALQMKVDAATIAVKALKSPKDHQACAGFLAPLIEEAVNADRYALAKSLAALALGSAREGRDADRIKQMVAKAKEIEEIASEFEKVKEAKVALDAKPTDSAANFAVGKFLCLLKGDWKRGMTMLALGDNEEFKTTALLELEATPDPLKLGDGWWKISESLEGTPKSRTQIHAGEWYRKALAGLSGLTKARVEKLVSQLPQDANHQPSVLLVENVSEKQRQDNLHPVIGKWRTKAGTIIEMYPNGTAVSSKGSKGIWVVREQRAAAIKWSEGSNEIVTVSVDGKSADSKLRRADGKTGGSIWKLIERNDVEVYEEKPTKKGPK